MSRHLICLTIDTDPDGLSGPTTDRRALSWRGLERIGDLVNCLDDGGQDAARPVPITWFVRADGQIRDQLGSTTWLFETFAARWTAATARGDEIGWHPHLYRHARGEHEPTLILDPREACEELERLWSDLTAAGVRAACFRNGEAWHLSETYALVERLGFSVDSTVVPGRGGVAGHPMDWRGAPNEAYYPCANDLRRPGPRRALLEVPMNTWRVAAPHDERPKLRYMNPAIHAALFDRALADLPVRSIAPPAIWVLILHPDEVMMAARPDGLYAHSVRSTCRNVRALCRRLEQEGAAEFVTLSEAAARRRAAQQL